jgi:hypothetical protein
MKSFIFSKTAALLASALALGISAQADTVSITYIDAPTGVTNGSDYVAPYLLSINGVQTDATCYDFFDNIVGGQSWTANELTLSQAAESGQFSKDANAVTGYEDVGFLSQQSTSTAQSQVALQQSTSVNQIALQQDIWNVFDPGKFAVSPAMQDYLNLLTTSAFTNFDFNSVLFLEDVNQGTGRAQAFVIDPSPTPEPGTVAMMGGGALLFGIGMIKRRKLS